MADLMIVAGEHIKGAGQPLYQLALPYCTHIALATQPPTDCATPGRSVPPRLAVRCRAVRHAAEGLQLRAARGPGALRAEEGLRGRAVLTPPLAAASFASFVPIALLIFVARFDGWTRVGSPGCLAY